MEFNPVIEYWDTISPLSEGSWNRNFRLCSAVDTFYIRQVPYHNPSCSQKAVTLFGLSSPWFFWGSGICFHSLMDFWTQRERERVGWFGRMAFQHVYYHVRIKSPVYVWKKKKKKTMANVPFNSGAKINFTQEASSVFHRFITRIWRLFPELIHHCPAFSREHHRCAVFPPVDWSLSKPLTRYSFYTL